MGNRAHVVIDMESRRGTCMYVSTTYPLVVKKVVMKRGH